jgi:hypothetical protein
VLHLHECAAEPLQYVVESIAYPIVVESVVAPLHEVADLAANGAAPTETSSL